MTGRPWGKRASGKPAPKAKTPARRGSLKIRFRGKDDTPLSIPQLKQGLYQLLQDLEPYSSTYRAKSASLYLTIVDEHGQEVCLFGTTERSIFPYRSAADELDGSASPDP